MSECVSEYFVFNGVLEENTNFDEKVKFDGITLYEVIRVIDEVPLFLEEHLTRLENSAKLSGAQLLYNNIDIKKQIELLIKANKVREGNIKIVFNYNISTIFCAYFIKHKYPTDEMYSKGVGTILFHSERNNPNVKYVNADFRKTVDAKIISENVFEAILVDNSGYITEGSKSNIFMVKGNNLYTAPLKDVLPGVTRGRVLNIAKKLEIDTFEKNINVTDLFEMDALFITGTSPKVLPINEVDGHKFDSIKNPVIIKIIIEYDNLVQEYVNLSKNDTVL